MPNPPNIDGLPLWLQICITVLFGLATLFVAAKGYFSSTRGGEGAAMLSGSAGAQPIQQVQSAAIADMGAIRHLSDVCIILSGKIESSEQATREHTHWLRSQHELDREICARLRELKEALERKG